MNKKPTRNSVSLIFMILLGLVLAFLVLRQPASTSTDLKYSQVLGYFSKEQVSEFTYDLNDSTITLKLSSDATPPSGLTSAELAADPTGHTVIYQVPDDNLFLTQLLPYIEQYNKDHPDALLTYDILPQETVPVWVSFLPTILSIAALAFLFWFMMRQTGGGGGVMNVGRIHTKDPNEGRRATFADVAGADEEKGELQEVVEFLKNPGKFSTLGARIPRGVLLIGPPGTGKTLIARACAGEAGVPFYSISGSDFVELYVGVGASRVRDLFDKAKKSAPSIIFIDEIDAVGRQRGTGLGGGHDEREQTLNQLLVEMDGFTANDGVIVIAATNRSDILDHALLRPGRFDRQIYVGLPDVRGREQILKVHTRNKPIAPDVNLATIAKSTPGFTGADLENLVNEAALLAARRNKKAITQSEIEEASIKVVAGPEKKSRLVTPKERRLAAFHEGGHAIATYYTKTGELVHKITIVPRGAAGGFTMSLPSEDSNYTTKHQMEDEVAILLGGRVAEKLVLGEISTGASSDLERATSIARSMVTRYGFSESLGPIVYGSDPSETFLGRDFSTGRGYSEAVAAEIDSEMHRIVDDAYEQSEEILKAHRDQLDRLAEALLAHETIDGGEFTAIMEGRDPWAGKTPAQPAPAAPAAVPPAAPADAVPPAAGPAKPETPAPDAGAPAESGSAPAESAPPADPKT